MKKVTDSKAGQSISAFVVIDPKGKLVARVHAHYGDSGRVQVDCYDWGKSGKGLQQGSAGGGGYDKFAAAFRGMVIDGHVMMDHSSTDDESKAVLDRYQSGELTEQNVRDQYPWMSLVNWSTEEGRYTSLYVEPGLDQLKRRGYIVVQAI